MIGSLRSFQTFPSLLSYREVAKLFTIGEMLHWAGPGLGPLMEGSCPPAETLEDSITTCVRRLCYKSPNKKKAGHEKQKDNRIDARIAYRIGVKNNAMPYIATFVAAKKI